jgi:4-hydroxy-4-methyl-2-oxoglutarate aldolase
LSDRRDLSAADIASVGGNDVAVICGLEPAWPEARASGRAFTVAGSPGDNLALHRALVEAAPGDVIVLSVSGCRDCAHLGDIIARAAQHRHLAGIVVDGAIRDRADVAALGFPVFHDGTSPRKPEKAVAGDLGVPVELRGVLVYPEDFIVADADGVVVVPGRLVSNIVARAYELVARERDIVSGISKGKTTLEIYDL